MNRAEVLSRIARSDGGVEVVNLNGGLIGGFRNKIINSDFLIHQRGGIATATSAFGADRWKQSTGGTGGDTQLAQEFLLDTARDAVPGRPKCALRYTVSTFGAGTPYFQQTVEALEETQDKQLSLTFWHRGSTGLVAEAQIWQHFGTGGSASSPVLVDAFPFNPTATIKRETFVYDMPSLAGKTIGSNKNTHHLIVRFVVPPATSDTGFFDLIRPSLVEGDVSNEFDPTSPRHPQQEASLCQRYFRAMPMLGMAGFAFTTDSFAMAVPAYGMRAVPSISLADTAPQIVASNGVTVVNGATIAASVGGADGSYVRIQGTPSRTIVKDETVVGHSSIPAIFLDAEL